MVENKLGTIPYPGWQTLESQVVPDVGELLKQNKLIHLSLCNRPLAQPLEKIVHHHWPS